MVNAYIYDTAVGKMLITEDGESITGLSLLSEKEEKSLTELSLFKDAENMAKRLQLPCEYRLCETELLKEAAKQLKEYFQGTRKIFDIKLNPRGTQFQKKVWDALRAIPYGETRSYKQIAEAVGNAKASRAVGMANHNNPIMCIIPCHRVIGADGSLVGFGAGLAVKEQLLNLEKKYSL